MEREFSNNRMDDSIVNTETNILMIDNSDTSPVRVDYMEKTDNVDSHEKSDDESCEEEEEIELSPGGVLDEETITRGLSNLGRSADGTQYVYLHLTIPGFSLKDISLLQEYIHVQKVELPYNELTDLSPLSNLPYLLILDASHNQISKLLDFVPPKNLQDVDLSFNQIEEMSDLSQHHYLRQLKLDNNFIKDIKGIQNCKRLAHLSLAHNKVEHISGMDDLPIQILNLCHNEIKKIENLETLDKLRNINLAGNKVRSLDGLQDHSLLEFIDLEDNEVIDISEMKFIMNLNMLRQLNLLRNPIQELPDYRLSVLFRIQRLTELDRKKVDAEEKVSAINMFSPSPELIASRDHITHVVYSFLQPSKVWDSTLPSTETPYPMLVLVGPQGSGKKDLALKLVEEFSDYFGYGISHTTRDSYPEEEEGKDYNFVSLDKFEMDINFGQFIATYQSGGDWYGLQRESIESLAREGLACALHMELEGMLTLKNTHFEPRYVLVLPTNPDEHEKRLRERGIYTEKQIETILKKSEWYMSYNQDHPGIFDMMIAGDDIQEAYKQLRKLVMDYLGIRQQTPPSSSEIEGKQVVDTTLTPPNENGQETNQMELRTASKPSLSDSLAHSSINRLKTSPPPPVGRGIVEEESLKRRHISAKEAVAGIVPPLYEQLSRECPRTAPENVGSQVGLGDKETHRSMSAPGKTDTDMLPPGSPDSSIAESASSSSLSQLSSTSDMLRVGSPEDRQIEDKTIMLPTEIVNPLDLMDDKDIHRGSVDLPAPRPPSAGPRPGSVNRPGSEKHKVLPPIGSPLLIQN